MGRSLQAVRPISADEAAVVARALELAAVDNSAKAMAAQISGLQVVGRCECGCASVDFLHLRGGEIASLAADGIGQLPNGEQVGVMVWAFDDVLTGLEIVGYSDDPAPLPTASTVRAWDTRPGTDSV